MSDIRMGDVFDLPVWFKDKSKVRDASGTLVCGSAIAKVHTATAINSHDKLTEQNKLLREALSNLASVSYENEERLADRLYRDFDESSALVEAKELLGKLDAN